MLREGWRMHGAIDPREMPGERGDMNAVDA
jgi:hypothetical protein